MYDNTELAVLLVVHFELRWHYGIRWCPNTFGWMSLLIYDDKELVVLLTQSQLNHHMENQHNLQ